jgi:hypothetical protein
MGNMFGKPKAPPPVPPPPPVPEAGQTQADAGMKKARRRSGYEKTLLTGSLSPNSGRKTMLG